MRLAAQWQGVVRPTIPTAQGSSTWSVGSSAVADGRLCFMPQLLRDKLGPDPRPWTDFKPDLPPDPRTVADQGPLLGGAGMLTQAGGGGEVSCDAISVR
jgi:hypothetical protein